MIGRRGFLAGMAGVAVAAGPLAALAGGGERRLVLYNTHTGEALARAYWAGGEYDPAALAAFDRLLRDHRSGEIHPIDRGVLDILAALQATLGFAGAWQVISGYRSPKSNAMLASRGGGVSTRSLHMAGKAIDVRVPGRTVAQVGRAAIALAAGGVGHYPASDFTHLDVGRVRSW
ncbi:MAG: DUF882 domain-containing protein [Rhodospirillales bacterium]|nr:DUF882 domain-containing protein [Rhodospirillales bacterium]